MDYSSPGSSVHEILQVRILELVGLPFPSSGDLPHPRVKPVSPASPALQAYSVPTELPGKPLFRGRNT